MLPCQETGIGSFKFSLSNSETDNGSDADDVDLVVSLSSVVSITLLSTITLTTRVVRTDEHMAAYAWRSGFDSYTRACRDI